MMHMPPQCGALAGRSLLSPHSAESLSRGRSWETPARCPEKGVGRESHSGAQLNGASWSPARPSSQGPVVQG